MSAVENEIEEIEDDIFAGIDDLEDDLDEEETEEGVYTPVALGGTELEELAGSASVDMTQPMTTDEAQEITETIRSTAEVLYLLLERAHSGKAWIPLGYSSFAEYIREEFGMSRSRAYQILDQAKVISAIEAAAPEGTEVHINEAAARDLKGILGDMVTAVGERTEGMEPTEAQQVVEEMVEDYRDQVRDRREDADLEREEAEMDAADRRGFSETGGGMGGLIPDAVMPPPIYDEDDDVDSDYNPQELRRRVQAAYDLYSSLGALQSMPDVQEVIDIVPVERRALINSSVVASVDWLIDFREKWLAQPWQESNLEDSEEADEDEEDFDDFDDWED